MKFMRLLRFSLFGILVAGSSVPAAGQSAEPLTTRANLAVVASTTASGRQGEGAAAFNDGLAPTPGGGRGAAAGTE